MENKLEPVKLITVHLCRQLRMFLHCFWKKLTTEHSFSSSLSMTCSGTYSNLKEKVRKEMVDGQRVGKRWQEKDGKWSENFQQQFCIFPPDIESLLVSVRSQHVAVFRMCTVEQPHSILRYTYIHVLIFNLQFGISSLIRSMWQLKVTVKTESKNRVCGF